MRIYRALVLLPLVVFLAACQSTGEKRESLGTLIDAQQSKQRLSGPAHGVNREVARNATDNALRKIRQRSKKVTQQEWNAYKREMSSYRLRCKYGNMRRRNCSSPPSPPGRGNLIVAENVERPTIRPTVHARYEGKPPAGIMSMDERLKIYRHSYVDNGTIVYETDLAEMTLVLASMPDKKTDEVEHREKVVVVSYGMCLDFIDENLGKRDFDSGYVLSRIECNQENIGTNY